MSPIFDYAENEGKKIGLREGRQEGRQEKACEMARKMMDSGEPDDKIKEYTGLTKDELEMLKEAGMVQTTGV